MSAAEFQQQAVTDTFERLGDAAIYRAPGGDPVPCMAIVSEKNEPFPSLFENKVVRGAKAVSFMKSQVARPAQDATVTIGDEVITLGKVIKENRYIIKVVAS